MAQHHGFARRWMNSLAVERSEYLLWKDTDDAFTP